MSLLPLLMSGSLAVLNLTLAALVWGVRPRRGINVAFAALFAGNALRPTAGVLASLGLPDAQMAGLAIAPLFDDAVTVAALLFIPFLWRGWDRTPGWSRAGVVAGAVGIFLLGVLDLALGPRGTEIGPYGLAMVCATLVALSAGLGVLAVEFLGSTSRVHVSQTTFFLAAYALTAAAQVVPDAKLFPWAGASPTAYSASMLLLSWTVAAVALALVSSEVRARSGRSSPVATTGQRLLVLSGVVVGVTLPSLGVPELAFLLLRPILLAYGIFRFRLLGVERHERASVATVVAASLLALFLYSSSVLTASGQPPTVVTAVPLFLVLLVGALLVWPVAREVLQPETGAGDSRRRDVYLAALEESLDAPPEATASRDKMLLTLRGRLGISDREHSLLEVEAKRVRGRKLPPMAPGVRVLSRYRIERELGEGGFGRAFLAYDEQVDRAVVLKVGKQASEASTGQLVREARAAARVQHPGVVQIHDIERVGDEVVLVMEYVAGGSLADRLRAAPLAPEETRRLGLEVLDALGALHAAGLLHRDVKPANILLPPRGPAKLADLGIAQEDRGAGTAAGFSLAGPHPGSIRYMSPEQVRGLPLDARTDLYSLAATLHEALTGRPYLAFQGRSDFEIGLAIVEDEPRPPPGAPDDLTRAIMRALAKDRATRPRSAAEMRADLTGAAWVATEEA